MRILFISNYKFWLNYVGREKPTAASHHMFGMYQLIERFAAPNRAVLRPEIGGGVRWTSSAIAAPAYTRY